MRRTALASLALALVLPALAVAQGGDARATKIRNALSAAPESVAREATVVDHDGTVLRQGSNGWTCMPHVPDMPGNAPMCLDATWLEVISAWKERRAPKVTGVGISYMLQGDIPVSNTDPFATGPTPTNQWIQSGPPHIMVVVPDHSLLAGLPTDPNNGGPWVMWKGTPYAHIMIPTVPRPR